MKKIFYCLFLIAGSCISSGSFAQGLTPVALSGFTHDFIASGTSGWSASQVSAGACFDNPTALAYNFVSADYPGATNGLPANGLITSLVSPTVNYQLASYTSNNVLQVSNTNDPRTLTFVNAQAASEVYVLGSTGSGTSTIDITVTFTDNTTQVFTGNLFPDWFTSPITPATPKYNRISSTGVVDGGPTANGALLFEFKLILSAGNQNKPIASVKFNRTAFTSTWGALGVFAISINATAPAQGGFPPLAGFDYKEGIDTFWANSPSTIYNTSTGKEKSYWNIKGYNATSNTGPWGNYAASRVNYSFGDVMDSSTHFNFTFPVRGYYQVRLVVTNSAGENGIEKIIWVDTPSSAPKSIWFSDKTESGKYGEIRFYNQSSNGPVSYKWSLVPACYDCSSADQNRFADATAPNAVLSSQEPGVFSVCLEVTNNKGTDKYCRQQYITIKKGYQICTNVLNKLSTEAEGYLGTSGLTAPGFPYYYNAPNCNYGFTIAPCADTITVSIERLRLRSTDSVHVRSGSIGGPKLRSYGGNAINAYTAAQRTLKFAGQQLFVTFEGPTSSTAIADSGFLLKWSSVAATYSKPSAGFSMPDTIYSGYPLNLKNRSTGVKVLYAWDTNGDNVYGEDELEKGRDSITTEPTNIIFVTTVNVQRNIRLKASNCRGNDTARKTFWVLPIIEKPAAAFTVDKSNGVFASDTFEFTDQSAKGPVEWLWSFTPGSVTFVAGTSATSQHPKVILNSAQKYMVKLIAKNGMGTDSMTRPNYIEAYAYDEPNSVQPPSSVATDIGITRVKSGTIDTTTEAKTPVYHALQNLQKTVVYRGATYSIDVYRPTALDSQSMRIWIDFNRNTKFGDAANEIILSENDKVKLKTSATYTVPANAPVGTTRMRIAAAATPMSFLTPTLAGVGVFEDYAIIVGKDTTRPVLELKGTATYKTEVNKPFIDPGATAKDNIEGDITSRITITGEVDITKVGYYKLKYAVADYYGNVSDTFIREVQVEVNQTGPKIILTGPDTADVEVFGAYTEAGFSATDNNGQNITSLVQQTSNVNTSVTGTYSIIYKVTDAFGFTTQKARVVRVRDTQKPWIRTYHNEAKISGDTVIHQKGTAFNDLTYISMHDNYSGELQITYERTPAIIDMTLKGIYTLRYKARDGAGNISDEYVLYVNVKDMIAPVITLGGTDPMSGEVFTTMLDPGASAKDNTTAAEKLTVISDWNKVVKMNTVSANAYIVTYSVTDEDGNTATATRRVFVEDKTPPNIKLLGKNPFIIQRGAYYSLEDPGFEVTDNYSQSSAINMIIDTSAVNTTEAGLAFFVYYTAIDESGNKSTRVFRKVDVRAWNTGAEELNVKNRISLYPNPASSLLTIDNGSEEIKMITITNLLGEVMLTASPEPGKKAFSIETGNLLPDGLYFVNITGNTHSEALRLQVKH